MDLAPTSTWLLLIQFATFIPTYIIAHGNQIHTSNHAQISARISNVFRIIDITSPQRVTTNRSRQMSNHFLTFAQRNHEGEIRYNLTAFGQKFHFVLNPERRFIAPSFYIENYSSNQAKSIPSGADLSHCFYRGRVHDDAASSAVFDLCNGMRGAFKTRDGVYLIQPLIQNNPGLDESGSSSRRHVVTNHSASLTQPSGHLLCGLDDELLANRNKDNIEASNPENVVRHRSRREVIFLGAQSYPRYVEVMVTVDKSMLDHYGSEFELKRYIQTIMGVVHDIFLDPKIGNSIEIVLTGIKILKNEEDLKITSDARKSLREFCVWQHKQNVKSDADAGHYDTAILITRKNICRTKGNCETLGLAELGTMCDSARSCSIVEDNGLGVSFTVAHELGHVFNVGHDAVAKKCVGGKNGLHVMAPSVNLQAIPWSWSACSRQEITEFLERGHDRCLMDRPQYQFRKSEQLPGEVYSPTMQCKLTYGKNSSLCRFKTKSCRRLWCAVKFPNGREGCRTHGMPWAEGSSCGTGKWCVRGACVRKQINEKINGAWSPWSSFGPCSRTCGGGVTFSSRACNNPSPLHGGRFCLGAKKRFKSCQAQECPKGSASFRAVQCAKYNNRKGPRGSKWVPRFLKGRHRCQLLCERVGGGGFITAKVIDGTKCSKNSFDICVNGICRLAGCDNVLNSRAKLDICGVCNGRNDTCKRTSKSWHQEVHWGYNDVTTFLPGFSSIKIVQTTPQSEVEREVEAIRSRRHRLGDDNYLVLLNENYGNILNGGYSIRGDSSDSFHASGLRITYSGSRSYPEYIKIQGKLTKKIHLQVLSVEKVEAPKITYTYLSPVEKPDTFIWDNKGLWSRCSQNCQGFRTRKIVCKRERDGLVVPNEKCNQTNNLTTIRENCNTECLFKWMVSSKGTCQPGCGPGTQRVYFRCVKHHITSGANLVRPNNDCRLIIKPPSEQPCEGTCDNVLWVYSRWTECSRSCNGGVQKRRITCVEKNPDVRKELPESMCSKIEKRSAIRACNTLRCPTWRTGRWSRCSTACGEGYQRRKVVCHWKGNRAVEDEACDMTKRPRERQNCRLKACPHWEYEEWSDCSTTCGQGNQIRLVRCTNGDGEILREEDCVSEDKPISRRECQDLPVCDKTVFLITRIADQGPVKWVTKRWEECSVTCGEGRQERNVSCVNSREVVIDDEFCKNITKPRRVRPCIIHCGKWRYTSWSSCSSRCGDGTQERNISCVDVNENIMNDNICDSKQKPPATRNCVKYCGIWRYSVWTPCSSNCGRGTQRRQVKCFDRRYRLANEETCDPLLRPVNIRQCSNYLCTPARKLEPKVSGQWKNGSWSECSRSCGRGHKRRKVFCFDDESGKELSDANCGKKPKPKSVAQCNVGRCPFWRVENWSECSRTCGTGYKRRSVSCISDISTSTCDRKIRPPTVSKCNLRECAVWKTTQWTKCSRTCGLGAVSRTVSCSNSTDQLPDENCDRKLRPSIMKSCYLKNCPPNVRWVKGKWNPCSVQCGEGVKQRNVWCEDLYRQRVAPSRCRHLRRRPRTVKTCRRNTCGIWETGLWGKCSKKCGQGKSERSVRCRRSSSFVSDQFCSNRVKPAQEKSCNLTECEPQTDGYKWFITSVSPCSTTCGSGVQSRMVICVDANERQAPSKNCNPEVKPPKLVTCENRECLPQWTTGYWSECSKSCGEGVQRRTVTCPVNDKNTSVLCDNDRKPSLERRCNRGSCDSFYTWKIGPWSKCSATCGEGTMRRAVQCLGRNNQYSKEKRCEQEGVIKPDVIRECLLPRCEPQSCKDIQTQLGKQKDAEFNITISNKKVQVYCYGMLTNHPKEYITLRSGAQHNFAEYYHRSLKNPRKCPYNGARNDDCPLCHRELFPSSGGTYFSKVRFDVSRMSIIGGDFTFAIIRGNHSPSYGTAGDCYSKSQCPQGRFSIDLTNTGISLAPEVTWKSYGYYLSRVITIKEGRQVITGMCGGYCGVCRPYRTLRVTL
ncbi:A disintegrin and metalloproteinase with thrombospondin motifs 9-like [Dendronephthya gigantea]|uniref:A disintegrin and metalloproteinase with thrombospondin motifs 9-like n=1 Tax=Dendronephthya gigantea TaxID=151771 RepID=UPI00106B7C04|nr:A disintegrin and metalloproteinase with thrombospondin motifs 9-like [Dendronephthya gigantea]XP_028407988.1 A disintegrin and metalloproteinase with thrombospondin motifs 9-like [Dendronephthya gigantea]XP_028407989.1 A disintegrin and metalloproteinase with thrombospondin motifs 9-like [Dendronephthya gigantea]